MFPSSSPRVSTSVYPYELHPSAVHTGPNLSTLGVDIQLLAQTIIYYSTALFGLLVAIPVGITTVSKKTIGLTIQFLLTKACNIL